VHFLSRAQEREPLSVRDHLQVYAIRIQRERLESGSTTYDAGVEGVAQLLKEQSSVDVSRWLGSGKDL
jgi:hypothetical protein